MSRVQVGRLLTSLLLDEIDLFGVGAAVVNGTLAAPSGRTEGFVVCLPVVDYEILPQGRLCRFAGRVPRGLVSLRIHGGVSLDGAGDFVDDFGIVVVGASDDRYPLRLRQVVGHPESETRQRSRDGGYREGDALQRRVTPRFVVGCENRCVHPHQQFVVIHIEDTVLSVEIRRYEDEFYATLCLREAAAFDGAYDGVPFGGCQMMRHIGQGSRSDRYRRVGKMGGEPPCAGRCCRPEP